MGDNAIIQVAVTAGGGNVTDEHIHCWLTAVGRGAKVGITVARCLSIGVHPVVTSAAQSKVVYLEVTGWFIKAIFIG
jgi:hypothetical protein